MSAKQNELSTIFLIVFMDLFGFGLILPLLPYIAETFQASPATIGLLTATYSLFQFVAGPILGRLSDRYGRKKLLIISQLGSAVGFVILGLANTLPLLFLARAIDGITGGNISIAQAYMADITNRKDRAKGMGLLGAAFGLGFMLGPATGGFLSRYGFITPALFAASIASLTSAATAIFLRETINLKSAKKSKNTAFTIRKLIDILTTPTLGLLIVSFFFLSLGFSGIQGTYALFVERTLDWGPKEVGYIFGLVGIMAIITQLKILPLAIKKLGERKTLTTSLPIIATGFGLVSLAHSLPAIILANSLIPLGNSLANPTISALASEQVDDKEYGGTLGILQSAGSLGRIFGPIMAGALFQRISPSAPYFTSALIIFGVYLVLNHKLQEHPLLSRLFH